MTQHKQSHRIKWHDHHIKWHDMHQNRLHHHHGTAEGSFTAKKWFGHRAGRSPCAHSIGKFFLCYIVLFSSETSAPGSTGNYLYSLILFTHFDLLWLFLLSLLSLLSFLRFRCFLDLSNWPRADWTHCDHDRLTVRADIWLQQCDTVTLSAKTRLGRLGLCFLGMGLGNLLWLIGTHQTHHLAFWRRKGWHGVQDDRFSWLAGCEWVNGNN